MKSSSAKSTASCTVSCWLDSNSEKKVWIPQLCPAGCLSAWSALLVWFVGCCWNPYFDISSSTNLKHKLEFFRPFSEIYVHLYIYVYCYVLYYHLCDKCISSVWILLLLQHVLPIIIYDVSIWNYKYTSMHISYFSLHLYTYAIKIYKW